MLTSVTLGFPSWWGWLKRVQPRAGTPDPVAGGLWLVCTWSCTCILFLHFNFETCGSPQTLLWHWNVIICCYIRYHSAHDATSISRSFDHNCLISKVLKLFGNNYGSKMSTVLCPRAAFLRFDTHKEIIQPEVWDMSFPGVDPMSCFRSLSVGRNTLGYCQVKHLAVYVTNLAWTFWAWSEATFLKVSHAQSTLF